MKDISALQALRFSPRTSRLRRVWRRLTSVQKERRWEGAKKREGLLLQVRALMAQGIAEATAVTQVTPSVHRSTYRHWAYRFDTDGVEGLIDCGLPPPQESIPENIKQVVCALRHSAPDYDVANIVVFIHTHHKRSISESSVKRILKTAGLERKRGRPPQLGKQLRGQRLQLGGMKLLEAAAMSTGYLETMTTAVVEHIASLVVPDKALGPSSEHRDEHGRFLASYNERNRKHEDDAVGPGFLSVERKRELKDPNLLHVRGASPAVIERKLWALICSPAIGNGISWDGMRTTRGKLLGELCGFEYMPSTLQLFTGELKYAAVGDVMWETHARVWHAKTQDWGIPRHAAVLYVDGTVKPIWTRLFSQSTHVSLLNRVMPGLDVVGFHTGYGVPLWYLTHSGRAPLVKVVPEAIDRLEKQLGQVVARIVVIDAEGNSVPFLIGLTKANRGWVTRLRPSMLNGKEVINWTSYRAYRLGERIREGYVELGSKANEKLGIRLIEIERTHSGERIFFAASKLLRQQEWKTSEVADLYYDRWPNQESQFRAVNQTTDIKQVRGYGKQLVVNVAVTTELEELQQRSKRGRDRLTKQVSAQKHIRDTFAAQTATTQALRERKTAVDDETRSILGRPLDDSHALLSLHKERADIEGQVERSALREEQLGARLVRVQELVQRSEQRLAEQKETQSYLESRTHILSHDVELDSIFNVFKVGLTLLVTYVLKKMLDNARYDPATFIGRIGALPARQYFEGVYENIAFEYNKRDPTVMALLTAHCETINAMNLPLRSGRFLRISVDDPPPATLPKRSTKRPKRKTNSS